MCFKKYIGPIDLRTTRERIIPTHETCSGNFHK